MRFCRLLFVLPLFLALAAFAQTSSANKPAPGFSIDNIDKTPRSLRRFLSVRLR